MLQQLLQLLLPVAKAASTAIGAAVTFLRLAYGIVQAWRARDVTPGLYKGYWIDPSKAEFNYEVLRLSRRLDGFTARQVYIHKRRHDYNLMARPYLANRSVFAGTWATRGNSIYRGTALFHLVEKTDTLDGQWVGPHGNGEPNGGRWVLDRYDRSKTEYLTPVWRRILRALRAERGIPRSIIADIVQRHEDHAGRAEVVEGLKLSLNHGAFVPTLGKVSIPLIRYVLPLVAEGQTVLDLGTGSGFYAIYLAKHAHAHALGVDVSSSLIEQAMHNAAANGVEERAKFRICEAEDMFAPIDEDEKFDFIVANLPFSRFLKTFRSRHSKYYLSFKGTRRILEQLLLGTLSHARANSQLIFCYGESGYMDLLYDLIHLSAWQAQNIVDIDSNGDDRFHIFHLRISDELRSYFGKPPAA